MKEITTRKEFQDFMSNVDKKEIYCEWRIRVLKRLQIQDKNFYIYPIENEKGIPLAKVDIELVRELEKESVFLFMLADFDDEEKEMICLFCVTTNKIQI
jgi:hypothetical protein